LSGDGGAPSAGRDALAGHLSGPIRAAVAGIAAIACIAASACAGAGGPPPLDPDVAALARQDPQAFFADAQRQWEGLQGLAGSYQVRASRGINSHTLDTHVHLLRDAYVTIEVLAPGTATAEGYLTAGRTEVGFWISEENRLYRGRLEPGAFGRALGLELEPADIVAVLMGYGVTGGGGEPPVASWDESRQRIRVDRGRLSAWLHPQSRRFERVVADGGSGPIEVIYEDWAEAPAPVPLRLTIALAAEDLTLRLRLAERWHADPAGLEPSFFDVEEVRGAVETPLAQLAAGGGLLRRGLGRNSHRDSAAGAGRPVSTALRLLGLLDVLSNTPASPSRRAPCIHAPLHALATNRDENCGLDR
jgi:hypothetical protein